MQFYRYEWAFGEGALLVGLIWMLVAHNRDTRRATAPNPRPITQKPPNIRTP